MKKIIQFSKKISDIKEIKKDFFTDNKKYLKTANRGFKLYVKEKKRINCKNCEKKLGKKVFRSNSVDYTICENCSHLNGLYQDTSRFLDKLFLSEKGSKYEFGYHTQHASRVKNIYIPKINFLKKVLKKNFSILEVGCGAGHFIKACEKLKIKASGYDLNDKLISIAKKNKVKNVYCVKSKEINDIIKESNADVFCMISTLEHLENPNEILKVLKKSKIKYLYICIPLFSFSTFVENVFKNVYPRQLNASHTHLYTQKSILHMVKRFKFQILGEWWFGSDISDLYRSIIINSNFYNKKYLKFFDSLFGCQIDNLQNVLDKKKLSCEVHLVLKVR